MLVKTIKYEDFDGNEREEDFYFNLSKNELVNWNLSTEGGIKAFIDGIIKSKDVPKIAEQFKKLILMAYGEKSPDGKRFIKSEELSKAFSETNAFDELYMSFFGKDGAANAAEFVTGLLPKDVQANDEFKAAVAQQLK